MLHLILWVEVLLAHTRRRPQKRTCSSVSLPLLNPLRLVLWITCYLLACLYLYLLPPYLTHPCQLWALPPLSLLALRYSLAYSLRLQQINPLCLPRSVYLVCLELFPSQLLLLTTHCTALVMHLKQEHFSSHPRLVDTQECWWAMVQGQLFNPPIRPRPGPQQLAARPVSLILASP